MEGFFWALKLTGDALRLLISVLEFVAIGINMIVFVSRAEGAHAVLCSDSLNSVQVLNNFSAQSTLMQFVHRRDLELPAAKRLARSSSMVHCFGPSNVPADASSRGKWDVFYSFCAAVAVVPRNLRCQLRRPPCSRRLWHTRESMICWEHRQENAFAVHWIHRLNAGFTSWRKGRCTLDSPAKRRIHQLASAQPTLCNS